MCVCMCVCERERERENGWVTDDLPNGQEIEHNKRQEYVTGRVISLK